MRVTWVQPEDLLPHELAASRDEGRDVAAIADRWAAAGGPPDPPAGGASEGGSGLRELAAELLDARDALPDPTRLLADEPEQHAWPASPPPQPADPDPDRVLGAWRGRAAGCLLGKPVEKVPREGIREILVATWLELLPAGRTFAAERVAYRNLLLGLAPPATARRHNPFREWIGAAIRADVYGWVNPGEPDRAAALAWRDAVVSHTRGGVYGALWVAAMASAAMVASDLDTVLDAGEAVLPPSSRFAAAVRQARALATAQPDWEAVVDGLYAHHGHLPWVHGRSNAALVTAALVHGGGDFGRSICAVVMGGWDTDSNGATVGSVVGALTGAAALPAQWTDPLHDRLHTSIPGFDGITFRELATRTAHVSRRLQLGGLDGDPTTSQLWPNPAFPVPPGPPSGSGGTAS